MSKSYSEKLLDPRWQKKRLEILNRDEFKCRACSDTEKTLHVHHIEYIKGREPWDYDEHNFLTLCDVCHEIWHHIYDSGYYSDSIWRIVELNSELEFEDIKRTIKNNSHE